MNRTRIEYADYYWSPIAGCSADCLGHDCWAKGLTRRFAHDCQDCKTFTPHLHPKRLGQLAKPLKAGIVVVNYSGDMFGPEVPQEWRDACYEAMAAAPWHRYVLLTKQPQNITAADCRFLYALNYEWKADIWIGVSGDNWAAAQNRLMALPKRELGPQFGIWVSWEPITAEPNGGDVRYFAQHGCKWLVVGPETPLRSARVRPPLDWYLTIRDACRERGIPVWFKDAACDQYREVDLPQEWPPELRGERR